MRQTHPHPQLIKNCIIPSQAFPLRFRPAHPMSYLTFSLSSFKDSSNITDRSLILCLLSNIWPLLVFFTLVSCSTKLDMVKTQKSPLAPPTLLLFIANSSTSPVNFPSYTHPLLSISSATTLVQATVISCLDYYQSLWMQSVCLECIHHNPYRVI